MKILFLTRRAWPHIGGVEKHIGEVTRELKKKGHSVKIISEDDINYPHIKYLGLLFVWFWLLKNRKTIEKADVVHIHDVFIWYLPFRFLYPNKKVITTFHGLEWDNPLSKLSIWRKRMAAKLSTKTIGVGKYLEKYTGIKFDVVIYGAVTPSHSTYRKVKNLIVYIGRLESNTGLGEFLKWIKTKPQYKVEFCGDGPLRAICAKIGKVHGFVTDPAPFLKKAEYCIPGGYLGSMEALNYGCKLKFFAHDKLRADIWKLTPFSDKNARIWVKTQTWSNLANDYLNLYNHI